jgi:hypothetical protein
MMLIILHTCFQIFDCEIIYQHGAKQININQCRMMDNETYVFIKYVFYSFSKRINNSKFFIRWINSIWNVSIIHAFDDNSKPWTDIRLIGKKKIIIKQTTENLQCKIMCVCVFFHVSSKFLFTVLIYLQYTTTTTTCACAREKHVFFYSDNRKRTFCFRQMKKNNKIYWTTFPNNPNRLWIQIKCRYFSYHLRGSTTGWRDLSVGS